ncbi:MAG: ATP-binding protein [Thermodesulfobacteriota bacterium]
MADAALALDLRNDFADLSRAVREANLFLEAAGLSAEAVYRANLGLEEILTNIIKYGFGDAAEHRIGLRLETRPGLLRLVVEDDGRAFDPRQAPPPRLDRPLSERRPGGLGIHLVLAMMDRVDYRRAGDRNILEITIIPRPDPEG